jgi:hypothetical protein
MPSVGFEPNISAGERLQTHALDRAATGSGMKYYDEQFKKIRWASHVARIVEVRSECRVLMGYMKERDHLLHIRVDGRIIFRWILNK